MGKKKQNQYMTSADALAYFDSLEPVPLEMLNGKWKGEGVDTDHPLDGLLEAANWYGKDFRNPNEVYPLIHLSIFGKNYFVNPALVPLNFSMYLPFRDKLTALLFPLLRPFIWTTKPKARIRMTEFRGKLSATMIYDTRPINDIFRKIDDDTVLGLMDMRGMDQPYFFKLCRA